METLEKLAAIPLPVWIGLVVFIAVFTIFVRATNRNKAKGDFKVSAPEAPLANGSPYIEHRHWRHPGRDQRERMADHPNSGKHR
ncbi:hypothetical protein [Roseibium sp.]|uniref:hypothetical protein n=1 Tax=Roseibium sp. TaxID=1936156 RepID=UPI003D128CCF